MLGGMKKDEHDGTAAPRHGGTGAPQGRVISLLGILCFCQNCVGSVGVFENSGVLTLQVVDVAGFHSSLEIF